MKAQQEPSSDALHTSCYFLDLRARANHAAGNNYAAMADSRSSDDPPTDSGQTRSPRTPQCVQLFLHRYPHVREVSEQLLRDNDAFRDLCEEYEACTEAIQRLAQPDANAGLLTEYCTLRLRLEGELLRCIADHYGARGLR
jgi:hypothetical protein